MTHRTRQSDWCSFALTLQPYIIVDHCGTRFRKLDVFNQLYDPDSTVQIDLLVSNNHYLFSLQPREEYDKAEQEREAIDAATDDVFRRMAMDVIRENNHELSHLTVVQMMMKGMKAVYNTTPQIDAEVKKIIQHKVT